MLDALYEQWKKECRVLKEAPTAFILTLLIASILAFTVISWHYNGQIEILKDSLDNYRIKLEGMSPEEAQKRILTLEDQLKAKDKQLMKGDHGSGVILTCMLPAAPANIMEPPQTESFLDEASVIIQGRKRIDPREFLKNSYEAEKIRIRLLACQDFINKVWQENKQ